MGCKPCCIKQMSNNDNTIEFNGENNANDKYNDKINIKQQPINEVITVEIPTKEIKNNNENDLKSSPKFNKYSLEILEQINKYRKKHNANPLNINDDISKISQKHSDKIARENFIELSFNKYNNKELGEMIFSFNMNNHPENIISSFYEKESIKYNYNNINQKPSNFTQMLWKNSKYVGIGCSKTKDNTIYTVINFYPPGNISNEYKTNVSPPVIEDKKSHISSNNSERITNFLEEIFIRNNEYRERHGVPLLILNPILITKANEYAKFLASNDCYINIDIDYLGEKCGKNITIKKFENYDGNEICDEWYNEIKEYDYFDLKKINKEKVKNFTQLIWKDTKEVGYGWCKSSKGTLYVIGIYYPRGNINKKYQENVLPEVL